MTVDPLAFYTVCDHRHFVGAVALVNSLRLVGHDEPIRLLDCGLTAGQRELLGREVTLVPAPDDRPPYLLKPAAPLAQPAEVMALLDADMLVTRRFDELVESARGGKLVVLRRPVRARPVGGGVGGAVRARGASAAALRELGGARARQRAGCDGARRARCGAASDRPDEGLLRGRRPWVRAALRRPGRAQRCARLACGARADRVPRRAARAAPAVCGAAARGRGDASLLVRGRRRAVSPPPRAREALAGCDCAERVLAAAHARCCWRTTWHCGSTRTTLPLRLRRGIAADFERRRVSLGVAFNRRVRGRLGYAGGWLLGAADSSRMPSLSMRQSSA